MDRDRINQKLSSLEEYIEVLKKYSEMDKKEFLTTYDRIESTENLLRKSLQAMIDLTCDTVSKNKLGIVDTYYSAFQKLADVR
ncbi:MAG: HepT-like ribonuclease domain-containing protein [Clostridia bacterium]